MAIRNLVEARTAFASQGLYAAVSTRRTIQIGTGTEPLEIGIGLIENGSAIVEIDGRWTALVTKYMAQYEVPGTLDELVPLILSVYAHQKQHGGELYEAFEQVVADAERYLVGGVPARV